MGDGDRLGLVMYLPVYGVPEPLSELARRDARLLTVHHASETRLEAGLASGLELPYSCKGGVCSTCRCRLVDGEVDMDVNFALEDYEVARGFVLSCQSFPVTDKVVVDFDQAE